MSDNPNDWPPPARRPYSARPPHRPTTWRERVAGWPESLTSQQAARHAIVIAAIALVVATAALVALVFAVSANALDNPPATTSDTAPPNVTVVDVGTICVRLPDQRVLCEAREVWGQIVATARVEAAARAQAAADAALIAQIAPSVDYWITIGRCEQPGSGWGGIDWSGGGWTRDGHFAGGLAISVQAWAENDAGLPSSALAATPLQQMIVASRIHARFGAGAWSCRG